MFQSSYGRVENWGEPVLRNSFWRCYLPLTGGASVLSLTTVWPLETGTVMLIPPDTPVIGHADGPFRLHYAHFDCSLHMERPSPLVYRAPIDLARALDSALALRDETVFALAMMRLVAWSLSAIPGDRLRPQTQDADTERAYRFMKENLDRRLTNAQLAKALKVSESTLLRLFRQSVGSSPQREHLRLRLDRAATLLRETDASIDQIAAECGFWDRNHFSRAFAREWKTPPARYRSTATRL